MIENAPSFDKAQQFRNDLNFYYNSQFR